MDSDHDHQPNELLPLLKQMDILIAEGFKRSRLPKREVFRSENGKPPACRNDPCLTAVVSGTDLDWLLGLSFGVGGMIAMACGARLQGCLHERFIKLMLTMVVCTVVLKYVRQYL